MSEEEKQRQGQSRKASEGEPPKDDAGESSGPMGTGDPETGESKPMGTESAGTNEEAASHDVADEGDD